MQHSLGWCSYRTVVPGREFSTVYETFAVYAVSKTILILESDWLQEYGISPVRCIIVISGDWL